VASVKRCERIVLDHIERIDSAVRAEDPDSLWRGFVRGRCHSCPAARRPAEAASGRGERVQACGWFPAAPSAARRRHRVPPRPGRRPAAPVQRRSRLR
jgi:hypothetical protein